MCYEDIRIGFRRYAKSTSVITTTTQFPANAGRVVMRISLNGPIAGGFTGTARIGDVTGGLGQMIVNAGHPNEEMWFERHGSAVQQAWTVTTDGNLIVTEIIDNDLAKGLKGGDPLNESR